MKYKILKFISKILAIIGGVFGIITMVAVVIVGCTGLAPFAMCVLMAAFLDPDCTTINEYFKEKGLNVTYTRKEEENN